MRQLPIYTTISEARAACLNSSRGKKYHIHEVQEDTSYAVSCSEKCKCGDVYGEIYDSGSREAFLVWDEPTPSVIPCINWDSGLVTFYPSKDEEAATMPNDEALALLNNPEAHKEEPPKQKKDYLGTILRSFYFQTFLACSAVIEGEITWKEVEDVVWIKSGASLTRISTISWGDNGAPVIIWASDGIEGEIPLKPGTYVSYLDDKRFKYEKYNPKRFKEYGSR